MKKFAVGMILALTMCAVAGSAVAASSKVKTKTISVAVDFVVGDTLVKKGTYKFSFDTESNELTVMTKDKAVVAKASARLEDRAKAASALDIVLAQKGQNQMLISIAFAGDSQNIVVQSNGVQTANAQ
jgi:hypothetical protein